MSDAMHPHFASAAPPPPDESPLPRAELVVSHHPTRVERLERWRERPTPNVPFARSGGGYTIGGGTGGGFMLGSGN